MVMMGLGPLKRHYSPEPEMDPKQVMPSIFFPLSLHRPPSSAASAGATTVGAVL
jgi:hypothetical protein